MRHTKPLGSQGQKGKIQNPKTQSKCHFQNFALRWYVISFTTIKSPWKLKRILYRRKMHRNAWSSQKFSFKVLFEAHRLQKLSNSSLYLEKAFVDTKNVTLPPQHQKLHRAASYYKQAKLLQASNLVRIKQKLQDPSKWLKEGYTWSFGPFRHHLA